MSYYEKFANKSAGDGRLRYSLEHYNVHFRQVSDLLDLAKSRHVQ